METHLSALLGDLVTLYSEQLEEVTEGAEAEEVQEESKAFTENIFASVDLLLASELSWQEVGDEAVRYTASSECLDNVDAAGALRLETARASEADFECHTNHESYQGRIHKK